MSELGKKAFEVALQTHIPGLKLSPHNQSSLAASYASLNAGDADEHLAAAKAHQEAAKQHGEMMNRWKYSTADDAQKLYKLHSDAYGAHMSASEDHVNQSRKPGGVKKPFNINPPQEGKFDKRDYHQDFTIGGNPYHFWANTGGPGETGNFMFFPGSHNDELAMLNDGNLDPVEEVNSDHREHFLNAAKEILGNYLKRGYEPSGRGEDPIFPGNINDQLVKFLTENNFYKNQHGKFYPRSKLNEDFFNLLFNPKQEKPKPVQEENEPDNFASQIFEKMKKNQANEPGPILGPMKKGGETSLIPRKYAKGFSDPIDLDSLHNAAMEYGHEDPNHHLIAGDAFEQSGNNEMAGFHRWMHKVGRGFENKADQGFVNEKDFPKYLRSLTNTDFSENHKKAYNYYRNKINSFPFHDISKIDEKINHFFQNKDKGNIATNDDLKRWQQMKWYHGLANALPKAFHEYKFTKSESPLDALMDSLGIDRGEVLRYCSLEQ